MAVLDMAHGEPSSEQVAADQPLLNWARMMVVDAYYASPAGVKDLRYAGNVAVGAFGVPKEAVNYALQRSPFAGGA